MPRGLLPGPHVAELEQVRDAPVVALELGVAVTGVAGGRDHLARHGEPLLGAVGPPERYVPRPEGGGEHARVGCRAA